MDDIADLRCIASRLLRDVRTGTGQLGIFSNRLLRLPRLSECGGALQDRAADPNETPERERRAWEAVEEIWKAAFSPRLFPA